MTPKPFIDIVPARAEHCGMLCDNLREGDRREVEKLGHTPRQGVWRSYKSTTMRESAFIDGKIAGMWGIGGELLGDIGYPWLLTSRVIEESTPANFAILYRSKLRRFLDYYSVLQVWVDVEYHQCTRLMEICGLKNIEEKPRGVNGEIFRTYELRRL